MLRFIENIWTKHYSVCVVVSYWFLGLCNNFAYVIMLSAAKDILDDIEPEKTLNYNNISGSWREDNLIINNNKYDCNSLSTGTILLADVLPGW